MAKTAKAKVSLRVIYVKYFCGGDLGEAQGFYEVVKDKLVFISGFFMNDANYRDEYMSGVFEYLGVDMQTLPDKYEAAALKLMKKAFGM